MISNHRDFSKSQSENDAKAIEIKKQECLDIVVSELMYRLENQIETDQDFQSFFERLKSKNESSYVVAMEILKKI